MSTDEIQEAIDLTPAQEKAWASLKRAVRRCRKENIYFYQNLDSLSGLNGKNVAEVMTDVDEGYRNLGPDDPCCLQFLNYPSVRTSCSFSDDDHFVRLRK